MSKRFVVGLKEAPEHKAGIWFDDSGEPLAKLPDNVGPDDGVFLKIRRDGNESYDRALDRNRKRMGVNKDPSKASRIPTGEWKEAAAIAMSQGILVNWRNIFDRDGEQLDGTDQKTREMVLRQTPDLVKAVSEISGDFRLFERALGVGNNDDAKKSPSGSAGAPDRENPGGDLAPPN